MFRFEKTETENYSAKFNTARLLEYKWTQGNEYAVNDHVRPSRATGFAYKATTGGQSAFREPKWPTTLAGTVTDGSVTWEAVAVDANSTDSPASVNLVAPAGVTVGLAVIDGMWISVPISGGTKGRTYEISVEITTSASEVFEEKLEVYVKGE